MSVVDPELAEQLERLAPATAVVGDWQAIVTAARRRRRRRRFGQLVTVGMALVLGVSPIGGAIVDGIGDFSAWLRGTPGTPAAESDQQAFDRSNERSWAGFPEGTQLRSLIKTE